MEAMTRRGFLKTSAMTAAAIGAAQVAAGRMARAAGANDRVRVGVVGFSDRFRSTLLPSFLAHHQEMNFDIVAVSDLWSRRREQGKAELEKAFGHPIETFVNNEALYEKAKDLDAVIISTADFQHALHAVEACKAGKDAYVEKPLAETMDDANAVLEAVRKNKRIVQIGSQRRSGANYQTAAEYIRAGKFGPIVAVELLWNVNQPGRWRRPSLVKSIRQEDTDWSRFLMNRPKAAWDPRKYLEFRLFWPYSSGIPGQWMCHQIDTVHWFSGLACPRSVAVNGGIYVWKDGRANADTLTAVLDYGPADDPATGFQVIFSSRMTNSAGGIKEVYYSNGGTLDLDKNRISSEGGLSEGSAREMGMAPNQLAPLELNGPKVETAANTGGDPLTSSHMRNWMACVRSRREPNAPVEAGYHHSIAVVMTNAAFRTRQQAVFDPVRKQVLAGGKVFKY
jgi:predicted dehydrogenase